MILLKLKNHLNFNFFQLKHYFSFKNNFSYYFKVNIFKIFVKQLNAFNITISIATMFCLAVVLVYSQKQV